MERERRQWRKAQAARAAARADRHARTARAFVHDLVAHALRVAEHKERTGCLVPRTEYNAWMALLVSGSGSSDGDKAGPGGDDPEAAASSDDLVDRAALDDFLHWRGEWVEAAAAAGISAESRNGALADAVHAVRARADPPHRSEPTELTMPIRMAVVGGPFTGKSTLAAKLAEDCRAALLDTEALVRAAVAAAEEYVAPEAQVCWPQARPWIRQ